MKPIFEYTISKTNEDSAQLFDEAIKLFLEHSKNKQEIIDKFIQSFINEEDFKGDMIGVCKIRISFDKDDKDLINVPFYRVAEAMGNEVHFRGDFFKLRNPFRNLTSLFHELEHVKVYHANKSNSVLRGEQVFNYIPSDFPYIKSFGYLLSSNEHNSRMAEIEYLNKFIESAEKLMIENEVLNTSKNQRLLKSFKIKLKKLTKTHERRYNRALERRDNPRNKSYAKKYAKAAIEELSNQDLNDQDKEYVFSHITAYLTLYKDEEFAKELLEIARKNSFFEDRLQDIIETGAIKITKDNINEFILNYRGFDYIEQNIDQVELAKHDLLLYGQSFASSKEVKEFIKSVQDLDFKGVPIYREDYMFKVKINGEVLEFCTQKEAELEVLKYVDNSIFDNLDAKAIKKLNAIFGTEVIRKAIVQKKQKEKIAKVTKNKAKEKVDKRQISDELGLSI